MTELNDETKALLRAGLTADAMAQAVMFALRCESVNGDEPNFCHICAEHRTMLEQCLAAHQAAIGGHA